MSEDEKKAIIYFGLGLICIIIGMCFWVKLPNNINHIFCVYFGGQFIGIGREVLKK